MACGSTVASACRSRTPSRSSPACGDGERGPPRRRASPLSAGHREAFGYLAALGFREIEVGGDQDAQIARVLRDVAAHARVEPALGVCRDRPEHRVIAAQHYAAEQVEHQRLIAAGWTEVEIFGQPALRAPGPWSD